MSPTNSLSYVLNDSHNNHKPTNTGKSKFEIPTLRVSQYFKWYTFR